MQSKRFSFLLIVAVFYYTARTAAAQSPSSEALSEGVVLRLLHSNNIAKHHVANLVAQHGVDFALTDEVEKQLRDAGATDEVIAAVRKVASAPGPKKDSASPNADAKGSPANGDLGSVGHSTGIIRRDPAEEAWEVVREAKDPELLEEFASEYPQSPYADVARLKAKVLRASASPNPLAAPHTIGAGSGAEPTGASSQKQAEIELWKSIENSKNEADYQAYLSQYPNGTFSALAQSRIAAFEAAARDKAAAEKALSQKKAEEAEAQGDIFPAAYICGFHFCFGHLRITSDGLNFQGPEANFQFSKDQVAEWKAGGYGIAGAAIPKVGFKTVAGEKYSFHLVDEEDVQRGKIKGGAYQPGQLVNSLALRWGLHCPGTKVCTVQH